MLQKDHSSFQSGVNRSEENTGVFSGGEGNSQEVLKMRDGCGLDMGSDDEYEEERKIKND